MLAVLLAAREIRAQVSREKSAHFFTKSRILIASEQKHRIESPDNEAKFFFPSTRASGIIGRPTIHGDYAALREYPTFAASANSQLALRGNNPRPIHGKFITKLIDLIAPLASVSKTYPIFLSATLPRTKIHFVPLC